MSTETLDQEQESEIVKETEDTSKYTEAIQEYRTKMYENYKLFIEKVRKDEIEDYERNTKFEAEKELGIEMFEDPEEERGVGDDYALMGI